jgi:tetratricopeptide (TPR) repeat protein
VFVSLKKLNEAISEYQNALALNKKDPQMYCVIGTAYIETGDLALAISFLEQGVKLDTASVYPWCRTALENAK